MSDIGFVVTNKWHLKLHIVVNGSIWIYTEDSRQFLGCIEDTITVSELQRICDQFRTCKKCKDITTREVCFHSFSPFSLQKLKGSKYVTNSNGVRFRMEISFDWRGINVEAFFNNILKVSITDKNSPAIYDPYIDIGHLIRIFSKEINKQI